ncbi:MAG: phosphate/phosphite/phosphonate ABC transporter substrate-binding protein [Nitrospirota bacterium]
MVRKIIQLGFLGILLLGLAACSDSGAPKKVSLEKREATGPSVNNKGEKPLRIAVGGMITPREGFVYYRGFLDHIGKKLGRQVEFIDREGYKEINQLLRSGNVDVAFVCSGPYVEGRREFGLELLVAPQAYGQTVYYAYIIVAKDSTITRFEELRGRSFAFADPDSNTGRLVPEFMLAKIGETPDSFFSKHVFTYAHDKSIKAVAQGIVDGASVDSLIWDYADKRNPQFTSKTKIIRKSAPYAIPPVAVRPGLDRELKKELKRVFLAAHADPEGKEILKNMMIDKFVEIDDKAYDSIREMKEWVKQQKKRGIP